MSLGQLDDALEAFRECIEYFPRDTAVYRARYLSASVWVEKGDLPRAENLLRENLNGESLTPASKEWRDSLFALGDLLHVERRYPEAVARLQVSLRDPITIRMSGATMEEVLQEIVAKQGMALTAENGQVLVTDPGEQREKLRRIRYTVSDLTNNDKSRADQLADLVRDVAGDQLVVAGHDLQRHVLGGQRRDRRVLVNVQNRHLPKRRRLAQLGNHARCQERMSAQLQKQIVVNRDRQGGK